VAKKIKSLVDSEAHLSSDAHGNGLKNLAVFVIFSIWICADFSFSACIMQLVFG
jgi:hypothetical protein